MKKLIYTAIVLSVGYLAVKKLQKVYQKATDFSDLNFDNLFI